MATPERNVEGEIRVAARHLAIVSASTEVVSHSEVNLEIARLTAGDDPDAIDMQSPEFRAGAALALKTALNGLEEQPLPPAA